MNEFGNEVLHMTNISKSFPGAKALEDIDFTVKSGEVHALIGENGAGKSTLIKILMGVFGQDTGDIFINGNKVAIKNPIHARQLGLGAVYQDIALIQHLSVGENFFLGRFPRKFGIVDWKTIYKKTADSCRELDIEINPRLLVKNLTIAKQEMITIAKVVHQEKAKVVIFDEPTAVLAKEETEELFSLIRKLKENGVSIIYISHRIEEIFTICDTVTILKDGKKVRTMAVSDTNIDELITLMVGRSMEEMYNIVRGRRSETVLEAKGLTRKNKFKDISFELKKGEILGIFGLVGSGRSEVMRCIFGIDQLDSGEMKLFGKKFIPRNPSSAIRKGLGLLPEDRKKQGLAMGLSLMLNINLAAYDRISKIGVINLLKERNTAKKYMEKLRIKAHSVEQKVVNLSGGNQQKVVIGRWLNRGSRVFIFDEPTVGVDVGAKGEIYKLFEDLVANGNSIIIVSSYLPEVMGVSDRIIIMREGRRMGEMDHDQFNDELLLRYATATELKKDSDTQKPQRDKYETVNSN